ncbi:MAG: endonuclease/exonuclease/phosphatase family protein, partial [Muribaculaceae bacterium]
AGRDDGKKAGEHVAIFYRTDKFELVDSGSFWLAEDETKPVRGWDAAYTRICTWGEFKVKETGFKFVYFNVHLDNEGAIARQESAKLIMAKMNALSPTLPAIMAGDFNVNESSELYKTLSKSTKLFDSRKIADMVYCNNVSYNDFNPAGANEGILDYVFLSKDFRVKKYGLLTDVYRTIEASGEAKARTPSDHFPIMLILETK